MRYDLDEIIAYIAKGMIILAIVIFLNAISYSIIANTKLEIECTKTGNCINYKKQFEINGNILKPIINQERK